MIVINLRKYRLLITIIILLLISFSTYFLSIKILKIIYPFKYQETIIKYSNEYNLDPVLVTSIIWVESKFDTKAISSKGAKGLMQIASITGNWASRELKIEDYTESLLYEPDINIKIGCWYLDRLRKEFRNNIYLVLAAYNGGSGNVTKWLQDIRYSDDGNTLKEIPFVETKNYIERVNRSYKMYKFLYKDIY